MSFLQEQRYSWTLMYKVYCTFSAQIRNEMLLNAIKVLNK